MDIQAWFIAPVADTMPLSSTEIAKNSRISRTDSICYVIYINHFMADAVMKLRCKTINCCRYPIGMQTLLEWQMKTARRERLHILYALKRTRISRLQKIICPIPKSNESDNLNLKHENTGKMSSADDRKMFIWFETWINRQEENWKIKWLTDVQFQSESFCDASKLRHDFVSLLFGFLFIISVENFSSSGTGASTHQEKATQTQTWKKSSWQRIHGFFRLFAKLTSKRRKWRDNRVNACMFSSDFDSFNWLHCFVSLAISSCAALLLPLKCTWDKVTFIIGCALCIICCVHSSTPSLQNYLGMAWVDNESSRN